MEKDKKYTTIRNYFWDKIANSFPVFFLIITGDMLIYILTINEFKNYYSPILPVIFPDKLPVIFTHFFEIIRLKKCNFYSTKNP